MRYDGRRHLSSAHGREVALACLCLVLLADHARAQPPSASTDLALRFGAGYSDNILRQQANEESASYKTLGFLFNHQRQGARLNTNFSGDVEVREYSRANVSRERLGSINAFLGVDAVPDVFTWIFDDSYGQGATDPFRPSAPNNRQEINIFRTGPRVNLPIGQRTFMRMQATGARRRFQNTGQLDSDSLGRELGFFRALNRTTEIGLVLNSRDVNYDIGTASWETDSAAISYQRQLASGSASLRVGRTRFQFGGAERSSPLVDLAWSRRLGTRSQFTVSAIKTQADPGDGFLRGNAIGSATAEGAENVLLAAGVYTYTNLNISEFVSYERTSVSVTLALGRSQYVNRPGIDNNQRRLNLTVTRQIARRSTLGLNSVIFEREYGATNIRDVDRYNQLWFRRNIGRRLFVQTTYARNSRYGQTNFPYDENTFRVSLRLDLNP